MLGGCRGELGAAGVCYGLSLWEVQVRGATSQPRGCDIVQQTGTPMDVGDHPWSSYGH